MRFTKYALFSSSLLCCILFAVFATAETISVRFEESDIGSTKTIQIPTGYEFSSLSVSGCELLKTPIEIVLAPLAFNESNISYFAHHSQYFYNVLRKRDDVFLKITIPETSYDAPFQVEPKSYMFTIMLDEIKEPTNTFEPSHIVEYLIITTELLYDALHTHFREWKITNDNKINDILIVNVSNILNDSDTWVNGTYGDATNNSNGNPWIPDGKEIKNNFSLFNDTQCKIRNFIRKCVTEHDTQYVLLAGNNNLIPARIATTYGHSGPNGRWYNQTHASDMYYSNLHYSMNNNTNDKWMENKFAEGVYWATVPEWDEIDWGFDVELGRVPVNTVQQCLNWINKTKSYAESNDSDYLLNVIVASEDYYYNIDDYVWGEIGGEFPSNISFLNGQNISREQWNMLYDYCNGIVPGWGGFSLIHHSGHAGTHSGPLWNSYKPSLLNNSEIPNFLYSEGCHHGNFVTSSCIVDWMSDESGIFGGIANSAYGWFIASTWFGKEMFALMFNETYGVLERCYAKAHNDAREIVGPNWHSVSPMIIKSTNFFGDPSLEFQFPFHNTPPIIKEPNPLNNSLEQPLSINWSVIIEDPDGDLFDWSIECSNGQEKNATGDVNGTKFMWITGLEYDSEYIVWVNVTDGLSSVKAYFRFNTKSFFYESPRNSSYISVYDITLSHFIESSANVSFYWENHTIIGSVFNVSAYSNASIFLPDLLTPGWLEHDTVFGWYVNISNETGWNISSVYSFRTCVAWDINADGIIDALDASLLITHYGSFCIPGSEPWDINADGLIDALDISIFVSFYGEVYI